VNKIEKERINDLSDEEISFLNTSITYFKVSITKNRYTDAKRYCDWLREKLDINSIAKEQDKQRLAFEKKHHPIRPRRGDIYLAQLGQNIGKEINDKHLVVIVQNNKANIFSNTIVVIPISSSGRLYDGHEKIEKKDIKMGRLDKLPSKAKTEQIQFLDKARLIHKVAELEETAMHRIMERLKKILDV
jgi:mRNA interferase MazF